MYSINEITEPSIDEHIIRCPYCGQVMTVLIDNEELGQEYIEDCQLCCRPINFNVTTGFEGELSVIVSAENEV